MNAAPFLHSPRRAARHQSGVTLIIVLLILMVVTLLGVGGAQIALLAERATRYDRDYQIAFQAAEAALLDAEFEIRGDTLAGGTAITGSRMATFRDGNQIGFITGCGSDDATRGLCLPSNGTKPVWASVDFTDTTSTAHTVAFGSKTGRTAVLQSGSTGIQPELPPRYIIEVLPDELLVGDASGGVGNKKLVYRITAMGFGPRKDVQAVTQTVFRKD
jgi:type IV pilus assembly protein PilX